MKLKTLPLLAILLLSVITETFSQEVYTQRNWNNVVRRSNFFEQSNFAANLNNMASNTWTKTTATDYSESYCGSISSTKFTTTSGSSEYRPNDAVLFKFGSKNIIKSITFSILDEDDDEDGLLVVAEYVNNAWRTVTKVRTMGEDFCNTYTVDLSEAAVAVMLFMDANSDEDIWLGATIINTKEPIVLPVTIKNFTANTSGCAATLNWEVGIEENFDHYEIERSVDGENFSSIAQQRGTGSNSVYQFTDAVVSGTVSYRLKMIDIDGSYQYSNLAQVAIHCSTISVFPNPVIDYARVNGLKGGETIILYSISGQIISSDKAHGNTHRISLQQQKAGMYLLKIIDGHGNSQTFKISKN